MGWRFTVLSLVLFVSQTLAIPTRLDHLEHHHSHHDANDASEDYYDENPDRSYRFDFDAEGYSREEEADEDGTVVGKYSYTDANGVQRSLSYKAGANIGFVPQDGNLLNEDILATFSSFGQKNGRNKQPLTSPTRLVKSLIPPQQNKPKGYPAPAKNPVKFYAPPSTPSTLYNAPEPAPETEKPANSYLPPQSFAPTEPPQSQYLPPVAPSETSEDYNSQATEPPMQMDASYNFNFDENSSYREEESDSNGNIRGKYRYINDDGNTIEVIYSAGAGKGFVIENEQELLSSVAKATQDAAKKSKRKMKVVKRPKHKKAENEPLPTPATLYGAPPPSDELPTYEKGPSVDIEPVWDSDPYAADSEAEETKPAKIYFEQPTVDEQTWIQSRAYKYGFSGANDLSRSEVANENGEVKGTYTFPDVNGEPILVRYKAGPKTGFVIENLDEVQERTNPNNSDEASDDSNGHSYGSGPATPKPFFDPLAEDNPDRSYQFSYGSNEEDASREEESDSKGNIRGKYRFVNSEGHTIEVKYSAGADKGFVIENEHELSNSVSKATYASNPSQNKRKRKVKKLRRKSKRQRLHKIRNNPRIIENINELPGEDVPTKDASYSFKVETQDSSREETSDENGERIGSYSFVDPHGNTVVVKYRAGRNGFEILNPEEVLPKAPQAY